MGQTGREPERAGERAMQWQCYDESGGYYYITGSSELNLLTAPLESGALWAVCVSSAIAVGYDRHHSGSSWMTASAANAWLSHTAEQEHQGLHTHTHNTLPEAVAEYSVFTPRKGMKKTAKVLEPSKNYWHHPKVRQNNPAQSHFKPCCISLGVRVFLKLKHNQTIKCLSYYVVSGHDALK